MAANTYQAEKLTGDTPRRKKNTVERVSDLFQMQSPSNKNGNIKPETSKSIKSTKNTHKTYAIPQEPKGARQILPGSSTALRHMNSNQFSRRMSKEDRQLIINNVQIVIHSAASVRFDDSLKYSIILNVRGTREVVNLALEVENLSVFVHISTTYCNADKNVIEEKIYPSHADWRSTIELAEEYDDDTLKSMTIKYIHPLPNTYTFAKSLSEHVVNDMCRGKIPAVIIRPSIVHSFPNEPSKDAHEGSRYNKENPVPFFLLIESETLAIIPKGKANLVAEIFAQNLDPKASAPPSITLVG
ncbi:hypothetical protein JTB14_030680 [Gonioctena quinquepunctata]|nr:hypothetical protein JTB14_030680 [Gonioctena quinquepunctata]